jgi:hypothetical protein
VCRVTALDDDPLALVGATLRDRYVVTGVIGTGSQGATLDAVDKKEGRKVAIKRFRVKGARSWKDVELAEREADVLIGLDHRLLPRAFDRFEDQGSLYLVMDKIDGESLARQRLRRAEVVSFLRDAAEVLGYLHTRMPPVIHRDIKPANFVRRTWSAGTPRTPGGEFVLVDFGSVRARFEQRGGSTVVGTFGYMAPEQLQGRAMPATDVYAVGVSALVLLTGIEPEDLPHRGLGIDVSAALSSMAAHGDPLVSVLTRMVEPDPEERASSIAPLLPLLHDQPASPPPAPATPPAHRDRKQQRREQRRARKQRRREEKRARREGRRASGARPWPPLPRLLAVLTLTAWRIQVAIALLVLVPSLLHFLSLVFGPSLRRAAGRVRNAGRVAIDWLEIATDKVQGQEPRPARRIESDASGPVRVAEDEEAAQRTVDDVDQAIDEAIEEASREVRRKRR